MLKDARVAAVLTVSDMDRAKKFYGETLGLTQKDSPDPGGMMFECGGGTGIFVYKTDFAGTNKATAAGFGVSDVDAEVAELRAKGVVFEEYDMGPIKTENGIATIPEIGKAAWFKDPDGNLLSLTE